MILSMNTPRSLGQMHPKRFDIPILIILSVILLIIGLYKPVITVQKLWDSNTQSILSSVLHLWHDKDYGLAAIIFFFSIIFPIIKLISLLVIWFARLEDKTREGIIRAMELLGRWSMLDVFVCAVLIVTIKLGVLASAKIEPGIYYFAVSIFLAMLVTTLQAHLIRK